MARLRPDVSAAGRPTSRRDIRPVDRESSAGYTPVSASRDSPKYSFQASRPWFVLSDEPLDASQLNCREAKVTRQRHRGQHCAILDTGTRMHEPRRVS